MKSPDDDWKEISDPQVVDAIKKIFQGIGQLKSSKANQGHKRNFTIDGRLVGDIGEVVAASVYKIKLVDERGKSHDAVTLDGNRYVQIKATFQKSLGFKEAYKDMSYIGLLLNKKGEFQEIYNGDGAAIIPLVSKRKAYKKKQLISVPLKKLRGIPKAGKEIPKKKS